MHLIEPTSGEIKFSGRDVSHLNQRDLRAFRRKVQMIFQDPYGSLELSMTIAGIIAEPLEVQGMVRSRRERHERVVELLDMVALPPPITLIAGRMNSLAVNGSASASRERCRLAPSCCVRTSPYPRLTFQFRHKL